MERMMKWRYVHREDSRHGTVRYYFRRRMGEKRVRMEGEPGSLQFTQQYESLLLGVSHTNPATGGSRPARSGKASAGTFRWLAIEYFKSTRYRSLDTSTQRRRRWSLESMLQEPTVPGSSLLYENVKLTDLTHKALRILRDRKQDKPGAANYRVKTLRQLFKWALGEEHIEVSPARDLESLPVSGGGFHTWTVEEVERFELRHPIGTKARLALALLLWTGVRRSDVVLLGRQHVQNDWLRFVQAKNRRRKPIRVDVPLLPELRAVLVASPTGDLTFLVNDYGQPFTAPGFGNKMRQWCLEAGVPGSAHGLRKAGAVTAAENGATAHQLMSIFGWLTLAEAERYTRAAGRKKMAGDAMGLLVRKT